MDTLTLRNIDTDETVEIPVIDGVATVPPGRYEPPADLPPITFRINAGSTFAVE